MTDRRTVKAIIDYRLRQSVIDNPFFSIEFRIIDNRFTSLLVFNVMRSKEGFFVGHI